MSEPAHLSEALSAFLSNHDNGWFTPLMEALDGLSVEQAAWSPAEGANSIWAIAFHVAYWQEFVLRRLQGLPVPRRIPGAVEGWPSPDPPDQDAWDEVRHRLQSDNRAMAVYVESLTNDELALPIREGGQARYQAIDGLIGHISYHTGEVSYIRGLQGSWPEGSPL